MVRCNNYDATVTGYIFAQNTIQKLWSGSGTSALCESGPCWHFVQKRGFEHKAKVTMTIEKLKTPQIGTILSFKIQLVT